MTNEIELVTLDRNLSITLNATKQNLHCNTKCIVNTFVFTTASLKIYLQHLSRRPQTMIDACSQTWYLTVIWRMATLLIVTVSVVAVWISHIGWWSAWDLSRSVTFPRFMQFSTLSSWRKCWCSSRRYISHIHRRLFLLMHYKRKNSRIPLHLTKIVTQCSDSFSTCCKGRQKIFQWKLPRNKPWLCSQKFQTHRFVQHQLQKRHAVTVG